MKPPWPSSPTSCDICSSVVASQTDLHARFGGVVPEVAARAHLQRLLPVLDEALRLAQIKLADVGCIAVLNTPGLVGALLVGVSAAKMLALALEIPLVAANHVEAHIFACRLAARRDIFPCVGLVVSGGHTSLFHCHAALQFDLIGATLDDAAGEAFDKVASILGLGFPGGPAVEREAQQGDAQAFRFPRSFRRDDRLDFSFSGLKTAVLYAVHGMGVAQGPPPPPGKVRADLAASFQQAVVDVLVEKSRQALRKTGLPAWRSAAASRPTAVCGSALAEHGGRRESGAVHSAVDACAPTTPPWPPWPSRNGGSDYGPLSIWMPRPAAKRAGKEAARSRKPDHSMVQTATSENH